MNGKIKNNSGFFCIYELNKEIMMRITDVEDLISLYKTSKYLASIIEEEDILRNLTKYYRLPNKPTFASFVNAHDAKWASARCDKHYTYGERNTRWTCLDMARNDQKESLVKKFLFDSQSATQIISDAARSGIDEIYLKATDLIPINFVDWVKVLPSAISSENKKIFDDVIVKLGPCIQFNELYKKEIAEALSKISNLIFYKYSRNCLPCNIKCETLLPVLAASRAHWEVMNNILQEKGHDINTCYWIINGILKSQDPEYIFDFLNKLDSENHLIDEDIMNSIEQAINQERPDIAMLLFKNFVASKTKVAPWYYKSLLVFTIEKSIYYIAEPLLEKLDFNKFNYNDVTASVIRSFKVGTVDDETIKLYLSQLNWLASHAPKTHEWDKKLLRDRIEYREQIAPFVSNDENLANIFGLDFKSLSMQHRKEMQILL
jgi:hypothetical protein